MAYNEQKIQQFIERGKQLGKSREEIKVAYDKALSDGLFDIQTSTPQQIQTTPTPTPTQKLTTDRPLFAIDPKVKEYLPSVAEKFKEKATGLGQDIYRATHPTEAVAMGVKPEGPLAKSAEQLQKNIQGYKSSIEGYKKGEQGPMDTFMQMLLESGDVALTPLRNAVGSSIDVLTPETAKEDLKKIATSIATSPEGQEIITGLENIQKDYEELQKTDPGKARNIRASAKGAEILLDLVGAKQTGKLLKKGPTLGETKQIIKEGIQKIPETITKTTAKIPTPPKITPSPKIKQIMQTVKERIEKGPQVSIGKVGEEPIIKPYRPPKIDKADTNIQKGREFLYEAVNPTKQETKAVLKKRVDDLLPYIDTKKPLSNTLENVKDRIDIDNAKAYKSMIDYENNIGVKGTVNTDDIIKKLETKYKEKIGDSFINPDEARIADSLIETLKGFGKEVKDADILKIRKSWDKIEKKNKGFMMSAEATSKGDIFGDANKFFREEIRKSNPEYAKYLEKVHKTLTIGDVIQATIDRRVGQQGGGFIKRGFETGARIMGAGTGGIPGYLGSELLIQGAKLLASPTIKLTRGAKLLKSASKGDIKRLFPKKIKNGLDSNVSGSTTNNSLGRGAPKIKQPPRIKGYLPQKTSYKTVTPQTTEKGVIQESKIPLKKTKYGYDTNNNIPNIRDTNRLEQLKPIPKTTKSINTGTIKQYLKGLTEKNITTTASKIAKQIGAKTEEVARIIKQYIKKYGENIKDKLGDLADEIADKIGARSKLISDKGTGMSGKVDDLLSETKKYKSVDELTKINKTEYEKYKKNLLRAQDYSDVAKNNYGLRSSDYGLSYNERARAYENEALVNSKYDTKQLFIERAINNSKKLNQPAIINTDEGVIYFRTPAGQVSFHSPKFYKPNIDIINKYKNKIIFDNNYKWTGIKGDSRDIVDFLKTEKGNTTPVDYVNKKIKFWEKRINEDKEKLEQIKNKLPTKEHIKEGIKYFDEMKAEGRNIELSSYGYSSPFEERKVYELYKQKGDKYLDEYLKEKSDYYKFLINKDINNKTEKLNEYKKLKQIYEQAHKGIKKPNKISSKK